MTIKKLRLYLSINLLIEIKRTILNSENPIIIVEGNKDKISLKKILPNINIVTINERKFNTNLDNILKEREIFILTDFDEEGEKLYSKLKSLILNSNYKVNDKLRRLLKEQQIITNSEIGGILSKLIDIIEDSGYKIEDIINHI